MNKGKASFLSLRILPWGVLSAAGFVACAATLFGFLGRFSWFLDLFSHFRVQYFFGLTVLGLLFLVGHRRRTACMFLVFACVNFAFVLPLYFGGQDKVPDGTRTLRAILININSSQGDSQRVREVVRNVNPDILVLEEISSRWVRDLAWLTNSYPHSLVQSREDNFGIGLFSKLPLDESKIEYIGGADVPSILATVDAGQSKLRVIGTHPLPPGGAEYSKWRNEQLYELANYVRFPLPLILLGDLNVTPWNYHFRRLLNRTGLIDSSQGRGVQATWPNLNPLFRIPLDHFLHSSDIIVCRKEIGPDVGSDHYPVIVDFAFAKEVQKGRKTG